MQMLCFKSISSSSFCISKSCNKLKHNPKEKNKEGKKVDEEEGMKVDEEEGEKV